MTIKAFVLLSGGIDSTTAFYKAVEAHGADNVDAIFIGYGQRHHIERQCAVNAARRFGKNLVYLELPINQILKPGTSPLLDPKMKVPDISYSEIVGRSPLFVPMRNSLMLSAAAAFIDSYGNNGEEWFLYDGEEWFLYFGAHAEDAKNWAYPDCTPEFCGAMANAISTATNGNLRLLVPFQYSTKAEIILEGHRLGVPWADTWSCYDPTVLTTEQSIHCGVCPTCRARRQAFYDAHSRNQEIIDPTKYAAECVSRPAHV